MSIINSNIWNEALLDCIFPADIFNMFRGKIINTSKIEASIQSIATARWSGNIHRYRF